MLLKNERVVLHLLAQMLHRRISFPCSSNRSVYSLSMIHITCLSIKAFLTDGLNAWYNSSHFKHSSLDEYSLRCWSRDLVRCQKFSASKGIRLVEEFSCSSEGLGESYRSRHGSSYGCRTSRAGTQEPWVAVLQLAPGHGRCVPGCREG